MLNRNQKANFLSTIKWLLIALYTLISFAIMTTGAGGKARPLLLMPIVVVIALNENELISGICGAVCGLLIDIACGKLLGISGIYFLLVGVGSSFLFLHLMKRNLINTIIITAVASVIHGLLDFFFYYGLWGYSHLSVVFKEIMIPSAIFTTISSVIYYFIITKTTKLFTQDDGTIQYKSK